MNLSKMWARLTTRALLPASRHSRGTCSPAVVRLSYLVALPVPAPLPPIDLPTSTSRTTRLRSWTRSGDLTRSQAEGLLALDESTRWSIAA
jgi:hypothetical protein